MFATRSLTLAVALAALAAPVLAQDATTEEAQTDASMSQGGTGALVNAEGAEIGNASVEVTQSGDTLVTVQGETIPEGTHGIHLHMVGACDGPTFESAGEHIAGDMDHGVRVASGPHPGDLPNVQAASDGTVTYEGIAIGLTAEMLFDADGSALIIHADPDDYTSQPGGASGDRLACAVIQMAEGG